MTESLVVLGAGGMLGHVLFERLSSLAATEGDDLRVVGTVRRPVDDYAAVGLDGERLVELADASDASARAAIFEQSEPTVVINCVGILKPLCKTPIDAVDINARLPHVLAQDCERIGARLIHISTDCVFSGRAGPYDESSLPDAEDLYGRSKLLGEVDYGGHLTIRTSIIGRELFTAHNLLEWVRAQSGEANGFTKSLWSGVTTRELSKVIEDLVRHRPDVDGILHVAGEAVNKHELLEAINRAFDLGLDVHAVPGPPIDRRLRSVRDDYVPVIAALDEQLAETAAASR